MTTIVATEPFLVARTEPRERMSVNHGTMWNEYRIRHLEQHERPGDGHYWGCEWALEKKRHEEGDEAKEFDWEIWTYGATPEKAISDVIGDTWFSEADSLHALHSEAVAHLCESRLLNAKAHKANLVAAAAIKACEDYKSGCNKKLQSKIKGIEDEAKIERIHKDMTAKLKPEYDRLKAASAKAELDMQDAATRLNLHIDMEFDHEPICATLQKLMEGGNAVVSEAWMDAMSEERHNVCQYIRTCHNRKQVGTKDRYVAWIYNTGKPSDFEHRDDMTAIGSPS